MNKRLIILLTIGIVSCGIKMQNVSGKYTAKSNTSSSIELTKEGRFIYSFHKDGYCNGEIRGKYKVVDQFLKFENDYHDTEAYKRNLIDSLKTVYGDSVAFDVVSRSFDMGLVDWKIFPNGIKPIKKMQTFCCEIEGEHYK